MRLNNLRNSQSQSQSYKLLGFRFAALVISMCIHGIAFASFTKIDETDDTLIESDLISILPPQGETLMNEGDTTNSIAQEEIAPAIRKIYDKEMSLLLPIEPPQIIAPESDSMATSFKNEIDKSIKEEPLEKQVNSKEAHQMSDAQEQSASTESFAHRTIGTENGISTDGGITKAAYASAVKKQIEKNRMRPINNISGSVNISFIIDDQGHINDVQILNPVNPELASTAKSMIAKIEVPSPPGGKFMGSVTIKFE